MWIQSACWPSDGRLDSILLTIVEELEYSVLAQKLQRELTKRIEKRNAIYQIVFPLVEDEMMDVSSTSELHAVSTLTLAQQLFLIEFSLWRNIHPHEFLNRAWRLNRRAAPNLCKALAWSASTFFLLWLSTLVMVVSFLLV